MKYPQYVHWSEGQFLQPHHFQQMQHSLIETIISERALYTPYPEGLVSIEIDEDALRSRRVVIKNLCAIMPDGAGISFPGNCSLQPLTVEFVPEKQEESITVYLCLPNYLKDESNLCDSKDAHNGEHSYGRYEVSSHNLTDENTGDNPALVIKRKLNVRLITDVKSVSDCALLPIMKLHFASLENNDHYLILDSKYTPPYVVLDENSNLYTMLREFVYELKSYKSKILSDIENEGYDPNLVAGPQLLRLLQLQLLNVNITSLSSLLLPQRVSPFTLYQKLSEFLSSLKAFFPLSDSKEVVSYNHFDLYAVFSEIINSIRSLLTSQGRAECLEVNFNFDEKDNCYTALLSDEHIVKARDYYIALKGNNDWKELISDIETGDNFRVMDFGSKDSRVRGLKLSYVRFPPRYLPVTSSDTVIFKVMRDESPRIWRYIVEDHKMVIDFAPNMFKPFESKLYMAVVDTESET